MTIRSMTGFGRADIADGSYRVTCEVKAVNHRFFDLNLRLSRRYAALEERIREQVKRQVTRGRIEINLNIERVGESERSLKVDKGLAMAYHKSLIELAEYLGISSDFSVIDVLRLPEVFSLEDEVEDIDAVWSRVSKAVEQAVSLMIGMREKEGENLKHDIVLRSKEIKGMLDRIEEEAAITPQEYAEKLRARLQELLSDHRLDENRIYQEVAIFADRINIAEEIVRLRSHLDQMLGLLAAGGAVGRTGDFLLQEMFREINTIGSKANNLVVSQLVVGIKAELEKMREQFQNIE